MRVLLFVPEIIGFFVTIGATPFFQQFCFSVIVIVSKVNNVPGYLNQYFDIFIAHMSIDILN